MTRQRPTPNQHEAAFEPPELFFSTTDRKGRIVACNDIFIRIAEYDSDALLGAPHNIIRHPDMPRCVFKVLWDRLLADRPVGAYVKNLTRTGSFYWVFALALPIKGGFLSIRLKPTSERRATIEKLYAELLAIEAKGETQDRGTLAGEEALMAALEQLGFKSYTEFMDDSLRLEMSSRDAILDRSKSRALGYHTDWRIDPGVEARTWFEDLTSLDDLRELANREVTFLRTVGKAVRRVALNSNVCASRLADQGRALAALSDQSVEIADQIQTESETMVGQQAGFSEDLERLAFEVSFARLAVELQQSMAVEWSQGDLDDDAQRARYGATTAEISGEIRRSLLHALDEVDQSVRHLQRGLRAFRAVANRFANILVTTQINRVTGRSMAATIPDGDSFARLLDEMTDAASEARTHLDALEESSQAVTKRLSTWRVDRLARQIEDDARRTFVRR